jgi:hypothetical protein
MCGGLSHLLQNVGDLDDPGSEISKLLKKERTFVLRPEAELIREFTIY